MLIPKTIAAEIEPKVTERACGGWLAVAPNWSPIRIGTTGQTEAEARARFQTTFLDWTHLLSDA